MNRVSLKSQPACNTSVALSTGPADEEEEGDISWGLTIVGHIVVGIGVTTFQCSVLEEESALLDVYCVESAQISVCISKRPESLPCVLH